TVSSFYACLDDGDLHSFPTRRSSDLLLSGLNAFMVDINPWKEAAAVVNKGAGPDERVVWAGGGDNWFLDFYVDGWVDRAEAVERSEEHTSELQSRENLVCRLLLEKKK